MQDFPQTAPLPEAPGAKASRTCGLIALIVGVLLGPFCIGLPVALTLGVIAIVKSSKARRLAAQHPEAYGPPGAAGLVMGIISVVLPVLMLPFIGIVSAIAIPALLSQRARARDKAVISNLDGPFADLLGQYDKLREDHKTDAQIKAGLEAYLRQTGRDSKNPWNPAQPAFSYNVAVVDGIGPETRSAEGSLPPGDLGQCVYAIQFPAKDHPGYLAASARINNKISGSNLVFKKAEIE